MKQIHSQRVSDDQQLINRVVAYLTDSELAQLDAIAGELDVTRAWVIRRCLRNHLASDQPATSIVAVCGNGDEAGRHT